jgi:threonine synthase
MPREIAFQRCVDPACAATYGIREVLNKCPKCGALVDVAYDVDKLRVPRKLRDIGRGHEAMQGRVAQSGVWRFYELLPFASPVKLVSIGEGRTLLAPGKAAAEYTGLKADRLFLQYEGFNPSGSFKDNGMAAAFTHARMVGAKLACCASTGNTSASLAAFAAATGIMKAVVFVGSGKIAIGKLSQALDYGALTYEIEGDFDDAMRRVIEVADELGLYLVNSLNPFRLEGQKTVMYRVLEGLGWQVPDWIVLPAGNLGNTSSFGKAWEELYGLGLIKRKPRMAAINSTGADSFSRWWNDGGMRWNGHRFDKSAVEGRYAKLDSGELRTNTIASAIEINRPVNLSKALRALHWTDGLVRAVPDEAILDAKAVVGLCGFGCEPASAAAVAGARLLVEEGVIGRDERVVCILTGHHLKAPDVTVGYHSYTGGQFEEKFGGYGVRGAKFSNVPVRLPNDREAIVAELRRASGAR